MDNPPLILLDRDGTLITEQDYLKDPRKVRLLPGVVGGMRLLAQSGLPMVVVSNQSGVGRGLMTRTDVRRIHQRLRRLLQARGIRLAGIYWCPHRPGIRCDCRKPRLGLVRKAARDLNMTWRKGISVGDKWSDVALGQRVGGKGVLVLTGYGKQSLAQKKNHRSPSYVARNFQTAARWIIKTTQKESLSWPKKQTRG